MFVSSHGRRCGNSDTTKPTVAAVTVVGFCSNRTIQVVLKKRRRVRSIALISAEATLPQVPKKKRIEGQNY